MSRARLLSDAPASYHQRDLPINARDAAATDRSFRFPPVSRAGAARPARPAAGDSRPRRLRDRLRGDRAPVRQAARPLRRLDRRIAVRGRDPGRLLEGAACDAPQRERDRPAALALPDRPQHRPQRPARHPADSRDPRGGDRGRPRHRRRGGGARGAAGTARPVAGAAGAAAGGDRDARARRPQPRGDRRAPSASAEAPPAR